MMPEYEFDQRGPFEVGLIETEIASPDDPLDPTRTLPCSIWYPAPAQKPLTSSEATNATRPTEPALASHPLGFPHRAIPGLAPLDMTCPVIAFSHANSGLRQQSTFLTTHLASWGFVVIAPDHVGNTFSEMLELTTDAERKDAHLRARAQRPIDLLAAIRSVTPGAGGNKHHLEAKRTPANKLVEISGLPAIDAAQIGALGHSYGGWTVLKMPGLEPRVRAVCALAPASEPFIGRKAFLPDELPLRDERGCLVLAAEDDVLVDLESSIRPLFSRLGSHAELQILAGMDHFHFCDGLELLHKMHENNPRPGQTRTTRAYAELMDEARTHERIRERVTRFFVAQLSPPPMARDAQEGRDQCKD